MLPTFPAVNNKKCDVVYKEELCKGNAVRVDTLDGEAQQLATEGLMTCSRRVEHFPVAINQSYTIQNLYFCCTYFTFTFLTFNFIFSFLKDQAGEI